MTTKEVPSFLGGTATRSIPSAGKRALLDKRQPATVAAASVIDRSSSRTVLAFKYVPYTASSNNWHGWF